MTRESEKKKESKKIKRVKINDDDEKSQGMRKWWKVLSLY